MNEDSTILGKFKSVEALKNAYDSLQKEFTKKCQKLSLLQKEADNCAEIEQPPQDTVATEALTEQKHNRLSDVFKQGLDDAVAKEKDDPHSSQFCSALKATSDDLKTQGDEPSGINDFLLQNPDFVTEYVLKNDALLDALLIKYAQNMARVSAPVVMSGRGSMSLTPPLSPVTVEEAGALAKKMFNK